MLNERYRITVKGIVQGVGFRPFIHGLAESLFLFGWVINTGDGVIIEAEGERPVLDTFVEKIRDEAPYLACITELEVEHLPAAGYTGFEIRASEQGSGRNTYISPDVAVCKDCVRELLDKNDRRYLYPFINCTNCGPRFTIIKDVPYDRPKTTMAEFEMCRECRKQYEDIKDRRYHAQPVACGVCGPELKAADNTGKVIECEAPLDFICEKLSEGNIVAIKGIGGYHLSCNAYDSEAILNLRKRKHRDERPFALMARDLETVRKHCQVSEREEALLNSPASPIVLLKKRPDCSLPENISTGNPYLGIMLPYTPVHHMMFNALEKGSGKALTPDTLVMTSGNISSEPICFRDEEAISQLGGIADYFLLNNREIYIRTDDSVTRIVNDKEYIIRRSRGYVPRPFTLSKEVLGRLSKSVLACGGELKNTFCLSKNNDFYISHYIGDLENLQTLRSFEEGIEHFKRLFDIKPGLLAYDLHPRYLSTEYALKLDIKDRLAVQHHHAHIASCMAENNIAGEVIGVAFDGTGYGEDGNIWGGEFFSGTYGKFKREAHLEYARLPGGEAAVKEPLRMVLSYLYGTGEDPQEVIGLIAGKVDNAKGARFIEGINAQVIGKLIERGLNSPLTSSMGRLFDAASAAAGICLYNSYEGQAAIELEYAAASGYFGVYDYQAKNENGITVISIRNIFKGILQDGRNGLSKGVISAKFHDTIADMVLQNCMDIRERTGLDRVALSGGVFQNILLLTKCTSGLAGKGFRVYTHSAVPANDGGISLGQAVTALSVFS